MSTPEAINNLLRDMDSIRLVIDKFYSFDMPAVVVISSGCGLRIEAHHRNQPIRTNSSCLNCMFVFNTVTLYHYTVNNDHTGIIFAAPGF